VGERALNALRQAAIARSSWWRQLQARLRDGEVVGVPPYAEAFWLRPESAPKPV
jgi:hypothetical protein